MLGAAMRRIPFMRSLIPIRPALRATLCLLMIAAAADAGARQGAPPYSLAQRAKVAAVVPVIDAGTVDADERRADADAAADRAHTKKLAVATNLAVSIDADRDGLWEPLADGSRLWRVTVRASGATDLRLGFSRFVLPAGATLYLIGADNYYQGPYTAADATGGTFHSSVVPGEAVTIELRVPSGLALAPHALVLDSVGAGFRDLFRRAKTTLDTGPGTSGACNVNVVCPLGEQYPDDVRAVAYYEYQASDDNQYYLCTGTLLNDVPRDRRNYFLTAAHCASTSSEATSMVIYWNYQSTRCDFLSPPAGGYFNDDQHGATARASRADVDFSLVELTQAPDASWDVYYAGWDASGATPAGTVGIHHPSGDAKKVTAGPAPTTTDSCIGTGTNTHWWTGPYTQGTTEGGSSGSGLFASAGTGNGRSRLLIGTLSGGYAACSLTNPGQPDNENDCYGKFSVAWDGTGASTRLRDWLDPAHTGTLTLAGLDSQGTAQSPARGHSTHRRPAFRPLYEFAR